MRRRSDARADGQCATYPVPPRVHHSHSRLTILNISLSMENDNTNNLRTPGGILLKLFILKLSVCIATGRLGSLRHMPLPHHIWLVVSTIIYPLTPAVDFVFNLIRTTWKFLKFPRQREWKHVLGSVTGVYSSEKPGAIQLSCVRSQHLRNTGGDKSVLKVGRLTVVLAFTAQIVATLFLISRRINIPGIYGFHPDEHAFYCTISALAVAFQSLVIQGTKQECVTLPPLLTSQTNRESRPNKVMRLHMLQVTMVSAHITWALLVSYGLNRIWMPLTWLFSGFVWAGAAAVDLEFECETFSVCMMGGEERRNVLQYLVGLTTGAYGLLGCICYVVFEYLGLLPSCADSRYVDWSWSDPMSERLWVF